ncbi:PspC domain-containing protein [Massilia sp. TS11]|uniref:PspC domain-containing protein n=1 Tax=Massilia sp. TS11 TaxID=2908003 RepID=UPI001EDA85B1|nr:PspC domain-containing protein [Massilia sp. TS11]MCG2583114.1 PspC domain-containing protein [Massilia sp. TS11]
MSVSEELKRLHELHQAGALTDAEFEQAKAKLLSGGAAPVRDEDLKSDLGRLRRSTTDRWLGGVCGGLAKATGLESWVWRLIFVLAVVCLGTGVLVYLLMWIFIPEE